MLTTIKNDLEYATPESQGIASSAILKFVEAVESQIHEVHGFMLLRHGKVVAEGWWSPYKREYPHMMFSLSKSFTSTAIGLAVTEGRFSIDDLVLSFFPDEAPAEPNEHLAKMRVRHLLSMSTGHAESTMPPMFGHPDNWIKGFFEVPVLHEPGTHFLYNTGASYLLSAIVQKTTGMKLVDYLEPRLFAPLGIEHPVWQESPQGINTGGFGLNIKTEDVARFGQLYLQKGMWNGKRILPEAWVEEATSFQIDNSSNSNIDGIQGYGYQFWRCRHDAYRADGAFGQFAIVMQQQDAMLATTSAVGDLQQLLNAVWDILLPAMGDELLPDDAASQDTLTEKLSGLHIPPVQGKAESPTSPKVSGRIYKLDANALGFETITLNFTASSCTVKIKTAAAEQRITCDYGNWHKGQTTMFNEPWDLETKPIVASGAWTAEDTFTMVIRLYETAYYHTFVCHFTEDQMTVEIRVYKCGITAYPGTSFGRSSVMTNLVVHYMSRCCS